MCVNIVCPRFDFSRSLDDKRFSQAHARWYQWPAFRHRHVVCMCSCTLPFFFCTPGRARLMLFAPFVLKTRYRYTVGTVVQISPKANTRLSGLYTSGGMFCTQCEAEGFRRITFAQDRPDVMSTFSVRRHRVWGGRVFPVLCRLCFSELQDVLGQSPTFSARLRFATSALRLSPFFLAMCIYGHAILPLLPHFSAAVLVGLWWSRSSLLRCCCAVLASPCIPVRLCLDIFWSPCLKLCVCLSRRCG